MQERGDLHKVRENKFRAVEVTVIRWVPKRDRLTIRYGKIITPSRQAPVDVTNLIVHMEEKLNPQYLIPHYILQFIKPSSSTSKSSNNTATCYFKKPPFNSLNH